MLRFCMLHYRKPDNTEEIKTMQNAYGCGTIQTVWYLDREMTKYDENFAAINAVVAQMDDAIQSIPPTPFFDDLTAEDAALQQTTLYDAARIDGANRFQQALHVTLPSILPTIMVMLILKIGNLLSLGFEKVLLMYTPANSSVSDIIDCHDRPVHRRILLERLVLQPDLSERFPIPGHAGVAQHRQRKQHGGAGRRRGSKRVPGDCGQVRRDHHYHDSAHPDLSLPAKAF